MNTDGNAKFWRRRSAKDTKIRGWQRETGADGEESRRMFWDCAGLGSGYDGRAMNFALAFLTFVAVAFFLGWGIVLLMGGSPWLFIAVLLVFLGSFAKWGCLSS